ESLLGVQPDAAHALAPAALTVEVVQLRPLPEPRVGDHQDAHVVPRDVARHDLVAGLERHPAHAGGVPAHGPNFVLAESDRHAVPADHEDLVFATGPNDPDELVAVAQRDGDEA